MMRRRGAGHSSHDLVKINTGGAVSSDPPAIITQNFILLQFLSPTRSLVRSSDNERRHQQGIIREALGVGAGRGVMSSV